MKLLLIFIFAFFNYSNANEIQRIESIVKDISELRAQYAASQKELKIEKLKYKNLLIEKNSLKKRLEKTPKCVSKKIIQTKIVTQAVVEDNEFPKLQMKNEEKREIFKASAFRLKNDALIYDEVDGKQIDKWTVKTSFTSNKQTRKWTKITGHFVEKVWTKAATNMWIKTDDVIKRISK